MFDPAHLPVGCRLIPYCIHIILIISANVPTFQGRSGVNLNAMGFTISGRIAACASGVEPYGPKRSAGRPPVTIGSPGGLPRLQLALGVSTMSLGPGGLPRLDVDKDANDVEQTELRNRHVGMFDVPKSENKS